MSIIVPNYLPIILNISNTSKKQKQKQKQKKMQSEALLVT